MNDNIKLVIEISKETYLEIRDGFIVRNAMASVEAIKNGTPLSKVLAEINEEIGNEYANIHHMYPDYAGGLSHSYEIINKYIDKSENKDGEK